MQMCGWSTMRRQRDMPCLGEMAGLKKTRNTSATCGVCLQHIHCSCLQQIAKVIKSIAVLTRDYAHSTIESLPDEIQLFA